MKIVKWAIIVVIALAVLGTVTKNDEKGPGSSSAKATRAPTEQPAEEPSEDQSVQAAEFAGHGQQSMQELTDFFDGFQRGEMGRATEYYSWTVDELDWLEKHPPTECYRDVFAEYRDVIEGHQDVADAMVNDDIEQMIEEMERVTPMMNEMTENVKAKAASGECG